METTISFEFTHEQLEADPALHLKLKEIKEDPGYANDSKPGDIFVFNYTISTESTGDSFINRLKLVRSLDPEKFNKLAPSILLKEMQNLRQQINAFERFMDEIHMEDE